MKKILTTVLTAIACITCMAQKQWIDVTDMYIVNPRFDNNDVKTGWSGTSFGAYNPVENAEHYEKNFDTYQQLSGVAPGTYRLSLNAFYRMGGSENDYNLYKSGNYSGSQNAKLYAESSVGYYETPIAPLASGARSSSLGGGIANVPNQWNREAVVPNNMEAAYYWFNNGYYQNTVDCEVGDDGGLRIGIYKYTLLGSDWTCLDNWKLEIWAEQVNVSAIELSATTLDLVPQETADLAAWVTPSNATYQNVTWSSTKYSVATVDTKGHVTAVGTGTCEIVATAKDGSGVTARCKVTVGTNTATSENIIINEIMAANVDMYLDPSKNYGSWVELFNPTNKGVPLGGLYVSDDPNNLKKHRLVNRYGALPAHGFALLNFDHFEVFTAEAYRQIDDKLDCEGGTIIISDGTNIIAQEDYPPAISRMSYARTTDGGPTWGWTGTPSPNVSNEMNGGFAELQLEAPVVDQPTQLFEGQLQVCVNIPEGATLWYTDEYGGFPSPTNYFAKQSETGLFTVTGNTSFRFRLYQDGYLPSPVVTRTYILKDRTYPFPIVSVVTDNDHIYSQDIGVFQKGPYGRPGNGQSEKCNWNMGWDRPVAFDYLTTDNECIVSQECDFSMCGGWSRAWTPHSFKLKASKTYDFNNFFKAQLFEEKPYVKTKTLQIRNGGNDTSCRIKDAAIQQVVAQSGLNVDYQAWQPVHVFINGNHYAVLNMREANNKHFAYSNYGIDTDEMDQFEITPDSGYVQMEGTDESFLRLVELSENAADEETYEEIGKLLDIDEYVNYMAVELYAGNWDWPQNNVKGFRNVKDGKFHFVLFDLDGSLNTTDVFNMFFDKQYYSFNNLYGYDYSKGKDITGQSVGQLEIKFVTLFINMLQNDTFRKKFIDTFCIMGGSVFQPKYVSSIVNKAANYLSTGGFVNPWNTANDLINGFQSRNSSEIVALRKCTHMQLTGEAYQTVGIASNVSQAKILLNDIELPYNEFNGFLFAPVTLKAQAPAGYKFVGWRKKSGTSSTPVFNTGSTWKYYDGGSLDGKNWKLSSYQETKWSSGTAPIGYGKDQATETASNLPCYYFRKTFNLSETPAADYEYTLNFTVDDGIIVYVNGEEAGRYNMPSGTVNYSTVSTTYASGNPDTGSMTIDASLFKKGENLIAVEVHNNQTSSSDILWDAELLEAKPDVSGALLSTEAEYTLPTTGSQQVMAVFEELDDDELEEEGITPVRVNEISAANSMCVNDYFKKNDWIELYNTTGEAIDIRGMYISDKENKPKKYQVPSDDVLINTVIPAHGYKVIWCDKLDNIGADIHTTFKLEAEGGCVLITTDEYSDTLKYPQHLGTQSFGRYPDGGNDTYVMNIPTIGKTNQIGSYDTLYVAPVEPEEPNAIHSYTKEGGVTIAYVNGVVNVKSEDAAIARLGIFNAAGIKANAPLTTRSNEHFASIYVATLPKGIYIASVTTAAGDECHIKFVIK